MIFEVLIAILLSALNFVTNLLPSFTWTFPSDVFDLLCSTLYKFGGVVPAKTLVSILGCEIAYRTFIFTSKLISLIVKKIPFI